MDQSEITAWATANGWQLIAGHLSLSRRAAPKEAIVRLLLKATVVQLEVKRPAGKWDQIASAAYAKIVEDPDDGPPLGLGFEKIPSFRTLMQENRDRQVFSAFGKPG